MTRVAHRGQLGGNCYLEAPDGQGRILSPPQELVLG